RNNTMIQSLEPTQDSDQRRQPRGRPCIDRCARAHRRRLSRPRLLGHRDPSAALLHRSLATGGTGAADVPLPHAAQCTRESSASPLQGGALCVGIGRHWLETTPDRVVASDGAPVNILTGKMEHHISADVAYAVWQYWRFTGDDDFFLRAGAEIVLDTARFWASRAVAETDGKRHIRHVIGPDEYHEDVDDNAFTNLMARWNIARGLEVIEVLRERWPNHAEALREKLALGNEELADWRDAIVRIVTGFDATTGIYEQFAGFHALQPLELTAYA